MEMVALDEKNLSFQYSVKGNDEISPNIFY
jgi:hypothetical protein